MQDDAGNLNAVWINILLSCGNSSGDREMVSFAGLTSVIFDPKSSSVATDGGSTEHLPSIMENKEDGTLVETALDKQVLQVSVLRKDFEWEDVMSHVNKAKTPVSVGATAICGSCRWWYH
jgi:hypothetical protein